MVMWFHFVILAYSVKVFSVVSIFTSISISYSKVVTNTSV